MTTPREDFRRAPPGRFGGIGGLFGGGGGYNPYQQQRMPFMGGGFNPYQQQQRPMMGGGFNPFMGGGYNPYQQQRPMMGGGFNPYQQQRPMMGGGFNPYQQQRMPFMGGGFNPYQQQRMPFMGGGFNPFMGGGFNPYQQRRGPQSINDLFSGLDDDARANFFNRFNLATQPPAGETPPREGGASPDDRLPGEDWFAYHERVGTGQSPVDVTTGPLGPDQGLEPEPAPNEPTGGGFEIGTLGGSGYGRYPLGTAGPEFVYDDAGNPIMEPKFNTTFPPMGGQEDIFAPDVPSPTGIPVIDTYNALLATPPGQVATTPFRGTEPDLSSGTDGSLRFDVNVPERGQPGHRPPFGPGHPLFDPKREDRGSMDNDAIRAQIDALGVSEEPPLRFEEPMQPPPMAPPMAPPDGGTIGMRNPFESQYVDDPGLNSLYNQLQMTIMSGGGFIKETPEEAAASSQAQKQLEQQIIAAGGKPYQYFTRLPHGAFKEGEGLRPGYDPMTGTDRENFNIPTIPNLPRPELPDLFGNKSEQAPQYHPPQPVGPMPQLNPLLGGNLTTAVPQPVGPMPQVPAPMPRVPAPMHGLEKAVKSLKTRVPTLGGPPPNRLPGFSGQVYPTDGPPMPQLPEPVDPSLYSDPFMGGVAPRPKIIPGPKVLPGTKAPIRNTVKVPPPPPSGIKAIPRRIKTSPRTGARRRGGR